MIMKRSLLQGEVKPKMLTRVSLDPDCHQKLSDVSLRVFGGMKQKTQYRGRQASASHSSRLFQDADIHRAEFMKRRLQLTMKRGNQILGGLGRACGASLAFQVFQLRGAK